jgi:hypothetical protein
MTSIDHGSVLRTVPLAEFSKMWFLFNFPCEEDLLKISHKLGKSYGKTHDKEK